MNNVKDDHYAMVGGPELWSEFLHELSYSERFENDMEQSDKNLSDLRKQIQINCGRFEKEIGYEYGDTDGVSAAAAEDDASGSSSDSWTVSRRDDVGTFTDSMRLLKITPKLIE